MDNMLLASIVAGFVTTFGVFLFLTNNQTQNNNQWMQIAALLIIFPIVMVLSIFELIDKETISLILGSVVAYFFSISKK